MSKAPWRLALGFCVWLAGCSGHADATMGARGALDAGNPKLALQLINEHLETKSAEALPKNTSGDNALWLLDRAMVLQELEDYRLSSRDLEVSDKQVQLLDFSHGAVDDLGKYLFSDDTGPYKAPAYEKLMINTMNLVNYLVRGDLNGARIEARRLSVMQKFIAQSGDKSESLLAPGSYLAGFTYEKSGQYDEALRYYDDALGSGDYPSLADPVRRLSAFSGVSSERLRKTAARSSNASASANANASASDDDSGELLVIVNYGRVPAKVARRVPIGLALTYASGALSPESVSRANYLAGQGLVTWVNFPEPGKPRGTYDAPWFRLNGKSAGLEGIVAVDQEAKRAWEGVQGSVVASAITRMISRVAVGEGVRQASGKGVTGALLSLFAQATLTVTDTPDTRSWATLPARIAFGRVRVPAGTHKIELGARGATTTKTVTIAAKGFAVVNLTALE